MLIVSAVNSGLGQASTVTKNVLVAFLCIWAFFYAQEQSSLEHSPRHTNQRSSFTVIDEEYRRTLSLRLQTKAPVEFESMIVPQKVIASLFDALSMRCRCVIDALSPVTVKSLSAILYFSTWN